MAWSKHAAEDEAARVKIMRSMDTGNMTLGAIAKAVGYRTTGDVRRLLQKYDLPYISAEGHRIDYHRRDVWRRLDDLWFKRREQRSA